MKKILSLMAIVFALGSTQVVHAGLGDWLKEKFSSGKEKAKKVAKKGKEIVESVAKATVKSGAGLAKDAAGMAKDQLLDGDD